MFVPAFPGQVCSLGFEVIDWLLENVCHGPGDLQGEFPIRLDSEIEDFIIEAYRIDPVTGVRVYDEGVLSRPKGRAKTEVAGWLVCAEAYGPARFSHWGSDGQPVGKPVTSPLIKCLATEESQATAAFSVVAFIVSDWGVENRPEVYGGSAGVRQYQSAKSIYLPHGGEIRASTSGAASKDGGKETFVVADEALALDTPLPTPTGWTTMGEVQVGDDLIGSDGRPTRVIKTTDIMEKRKCWRIEFADGTSMVASDGHMWMTSVAGSAAKPKVRTTGEIVSDGRRMRVPQNRPLISDAVDLPIDPYVLGVWLGDGDARNATVTVGDADLDAMSHLIQQRGLTVTHCAAGEGRANLIYLSYPGSHRNRFSPVKGLKVRLRDEGLIGNKHIPDRYLRAGTEQRIELLRGLMDSDGHVSERGSCVFVQSSETLTMQFVELLRSLGQVAYVTWRADDRARLGGAYKVSFTPDWDIVPFALPRKVSRVRGGKQNCGWTTIRSITAVESAPVRCVGVEASDHLFMAGHGWKVTHNTHLYVLPELRAMYGTVRRNLGKRKLAQPWLMQTSTAYRPGEKSVFEETLTAWRIGELPKTVLVDHREAKGRIDIADEKHTMGQLRQVYGAAAEWMDLDRIYREMNDPRSCPDEATAARYFLNRPMSTKDAWIPVDVHERQMLPGRVVEPGEPIAIGFDGSLNDDTTILRGCCMSDGYLFRIGAWPKPDGASGIGWEVPRSDVLATVREAMARYTVVRGYFDPHEWRSDIDALQAEFGPERVSPWETRRDTAMAYALDRLHTDLVNGVVFHDDDPLAAEHYGNAYVRWKGRLRLVRKEHPNSSRKIDTVVGDALAYEARADALAAGWTDEPVTTYFRLPR